MHAVLNRAVDDHDTQHDMAKVWWQPIGEGPQPFAAMIRAENERWGSLIKRLGLRAA
jgi:tripartite-type tricarboxylate transporter receptor subunit TctC